MSDAEGERAVVGRGQGMSLSRVGSKHKAEREVEVVVGAACVGVVVVDVEYEEGGEEVVLVVALAFGVAEMMDRVAGKIEGGVLIRVDGK